MKSCLNKASGRIIGHGAFSTVFEGTGPKGEKVAMKLLSLAWESNANKSPAKQKQLGTEKVS